MRFRRNIYLLHRYLGIALCLLMAMWFASGMVLMYVGYPSLAEEERLQGLPVLEATGDLLPPEQAVAGRGEVEALRLNAVAGRPVYHLRVDGVWQRLDAASGESLSPDVRELVHTARRHGGAPVRDTAPVDVDQWTVPGRYDAHRPLVRVAMDDGAGTWLYLSSRTGEIVQQATRAERAWNWVGAVVHWIYPWQLRQNPDLWRQVVIWLCIPALALIITGAVVGMWRLRLRRRYKGGRITPYRDWHRWHHLLGIACTVFVFTFMLSGLFSMNPGRIFTPPAPDGSLQQAWQGGPLLAGLAAAPGELLAGSTGIRELEWRRHAGEALVLLHAPEQIRVLGADGGPATLNEAELVRWAGRLLPETSVAVADRLTDYDAYYYARRSTRPLPVLRVVLDDPGRTALYIDPATGAIVSRIDSSGRWRRWLYNGLHSLDFPVLWNNRPLWDLVVLLLSVAGLGFCLTGVVIGWRRLARTSLRAIEKPRTSDSGSGASPDRRPAAR